MDNKLKIIAVVGILGIILVIVGFIGFSMGDNKALTTTVKLVMAGVLAALGAGIAALPETAQ